MGIFESTFMWPMPMDELPNAHTVYNLTFPVRISMHVFLFCCSVFINVLLYMKFSYFYLRSALSSLIF